MYCLIEDGFVTNANIDKKKYPHAVKTPKDVVFGDMYIKGDWFIVVSVLRKKTSLVQKKGNKSIKQTH